MYRVEYENLKPDEEATVKKFVPDALNKVVRFALGLGDGLIEHCFGAAAMPGGQFHNDFDTKRKKMNEYLNEKCNVITFKGRNLDNVPKDAFAFMRQCCWQAESGGTIFRGAMTLNTQSDFLPSGTRVHLFPANFMALKADGQFNTIAHELTHRVIATTDKPEGNNVYGWAAAKALRDKSSELALKCAENWGYFYENVRDRLASTGG